jgi:N-acetylglucosamine-6-phosphate deacetylase
MTRLAGNILTPEGFVRGSIEFAAGEGSQNAARGHLSRIDGEKVPLEGIRETTLPLILPGFIDTHVHGGGGRDIMDGGDAIARIAEKHVRHGTTSMLATTMTAPASDLVAAFAGLAAFCGAAKTPANAVGAQILGVHLEGPYINPGKLGAQPDYARPIDLGELRRLNAQVPIRLITLAPEIAGHLQSISSLLAAGYRIQIGHSLGGYEDGVKALAEGASGFTHLFNAMTGLHHRQPGMVGAALAHAEYSEIIPDLLHVHAGAIRVALRCIPRLFCVTDSTAAAGMPDGEYRLGRHTVTKCLGGVRLPDGTLAGSTLTMDQAFRNLVDKIGLDIADASKRVSTNAADFLGLSDRGRLAVGAWADVVVMDRDLNLTEVFVEGVAVGNAS